MIYLDNAATTKPSEAAVSEMLEAANSFANPSSLYGLGLEVEKKIRGARESIANTIGAKESNIYFTSGGTEANNTVIFGVARARKKLGTHLITSKIEHPSVMESFKKLEEEGFSVTYLDVDKDGRISVDDLVSAVNENTTLISIMHVNNETGVIQPVEEIKPRVSNIAKNVLIHSDCVQSLGKIKVNVKNMDLDFASFSAHKVHAFKGTGAMYVKDERFLRPIIYGGEQQSKVRPGTENVGGILAFSKALEECPRDSERLKELRLKLKNTLENEIDNIKINGSDIYNSGSVLNVSFIGLKAEILLHALEAKGVYVSTGSACSSHKPQPSHVLLAMGLDKREVEGAIRMSFSKDTTEDELFEAAKIIKAEVKAIRRFM